MGCFFSSVIASDEISKGEISPTPLPTITPAVTPSESIEVEQFTYETSFEEGKKWQINADFVEMGDDTSKLIEVKGIKCYFYEKDIKKLTVVSEKGKIDVASKNVTFNEKVEATFDSGEVIKVDSLFWDGNQKILLGEGNVKLIKDDARARGDRIEAYIDLNTFVLEDNVRLIKKFEEEEEK